MGWYDNLALQIIWYLKLWMPLDELIHMITFQNVDQESQYNVLARVREVEQYILAHLTSLMKMGLIGLDLKYNWYLTYFDTWSTMDPAIGYGHFGL